MMRLTWIAPLLMIAASGCNNTATWPTYTAGVPSDQIELFLLARSNGSVAQVLVTLQQKEGSYLLLGDTDQLLFAESGGAEAPLSVTGAAEGGTAYAGQITTSARDFTLTLSRNGEERQTTSFTLPPGFTLTVPVVDAPRSLPIPIAWDGDPTSAAVIDLSGDCVSLVSRTVEPDTGMLTIQPGDLHVSDPSVACAIDVEVTRSGTAFDYAAGLASPSEAPVAQQIRNASISTVP